VGKLADFVVFDPFKAWKLNFDKIEHIFTFSNDKHILKNKLFLGSVDCVFIRGIFKIYLRTIDT
jgi:allantoinase